MGLIALPELVWATDRLPKMGFWAGSEFQVGIWVSSLRNLVGPDPDLDLKFGPSRNLVAPHLGFQSGAGRDLGLQSILRGYGPRTDFGPDLDLKFGTTKNFGPDLGFKFGRGSG